MSKKVIVTVFLNVMILSFSAMSFADSISIPAGGDTGWQHYSLTLGSNFQTTNGSMYFLVAKPSLSIGDSYLLLDRIFIRHADNTYFQLNGHDSIGFELPGNYPHSVGDFAKAASPFLGHVAQAGSFLGVLSTNTTNLINPWINQFSPDINSGDVIGSYINFGVTLQAGDFIHFDWCYTGNSDSGGSAALFVADNPAIYNLVDLAHVSDQVPEPTTMLLFGTGLAVAARNDKHPDPQ